MLLSLLEQSISYLKKMVCHLYAGFLFFKYAYFRFPPFCIQAALMITLSRNKLVVNMCHSIFLLGWEKCFQLKRTVMSKRWSQSKKLFLKDRQKCARKQRIWGKNVKRNGWKLSERSWNSNGGSSTVLVLNMLDISDSNSSQWKLEELLLYYIVDWMPLEILSISLYPVRYHISRSWLVERWGVGVLVLKMGIIAPRAGFEPTVLVFRDSVLTITPPVKTLVASFDDLGVEALRSWGWVLTAEPTCTRCRHQSCSGGVSGSLTPHEAASISATKQWPSSSPYPGNAKCQAR